MQEHQLSPQTVATVYKSVLTGTSRQRHLLAIVRVFNRKLQSEGASTVTLLNYTQCISRACMSTKEYLPVLTPGGKYHHMASGRTLAAEEHFVLMGFPVGKLDLGPLSVSEISCLAGNAMHVRMVGIAWLIGLSLVDKSKFVSEARGIKGGSSNKSKLVGS
jgi:hypothetical protein